MKMFLRSTLAAAVLLTPISMAVAQPPAQAPGGGRGAAPARVVLSVTSPAFPDGGEVPMRNAGRGENKSPAFEFHWTTGNTPASAPDTLQTYAVVFPP